MLLLMQMTWLDVRVSGVTRSGIGSARGVLGCSGKRAVRRRSPRGLTCAYVLA